MLLLQDMPKPLSGPIDALRVAFVMKKIMRISVCDVKIHGD
jgi:hypothetical protein